eukprot:GFYU01006877.1.p1 GENE.GFYU01006877.1~~GFYU01006877.1.p1  ORF type:complete len:212 (-),score=43.68 GFYU01006877.1:260-895(-)
MSILSSSIQPSDVRRHLHRITSTPILVIDGNIAEETIVETVDICWKRRIPVLFEPTSVPKASRALACISKLAYMTPNTDELLALAALLQGSKPTSSPVDGDEVDIAVVRRAASVLLAHGVKHVLVTMGKRGVLCARRTEGQAATDVFTQYDALPVRVVNTSGAGDSFVSGFVTGITMGKTLPDSIGLGLQAARLTLQCPTTIAPNMHTCLE